MRRLRFAVSPSWLALHVITVALIVTMIFLGRWQLTVSESKGFDLQNFGYAFQWWAFSIFVGVMWARAMRDAYRKHAPKADPVATDPTGTGAQEPAKPQTISTAPVTYRRYVVPATTQPADDPVHLAYNDWLAAIAAADATPEDAE
ncbi:hypothetical protein [Jatrophihabitans endophyticus]|uniref:hypothetical protein n=1 Tax=Jatrophihabitans endophyticus TaxID=1206085 RepID=UPI0019E63CFB|nr:hypothetical protein [Jatrophihabitans endophyticus]MBE7190232.1 hypothetical protein [Jatrophihabitans endophyticus]